VTPQFEMHVRIPDALGLVGCELALDAWAADVEPPPGDELASVGVAWDDVTGVPCCGTDRLVATPVETRGV
jgi:hypothetical protein